VKKPTFLHRLYESFSYSYCLLFILGKSGREYGIGYLKKLLITIRVLRSHRKYNPLSTWQEQLLLVDEILSLPKSLKGDVVECGCFDGSSTVPLSIACALTNRRLFVCDSFEGIPMPREDEKYAIHSASALHDTTAASYYAWEEGEFCSHGGLDGVKKNVEQSGNNEACVFVKGYFKDTLRDIDTDSIALIFEDADLVSSVEDCIRYLWPKLQNGCKFYCHEPWSVDVVSLFHNKEWWSENLDDTPPGFFGSGRGIIMGCRYYPNIGYAKKFDAEKIMQEGEKRVHAGSMGFEDLLF
jgi:O-methyltransferase